MGQLTDIAKKLNTPHPQGDLRFGEPSENAALNTETGEYEEPKEKGKGKKRKKESGPSIWAWVERALSEEYIFLYNEITCRTEYAHVNRPGRKRPLGDRDLQSIVRVLQTEKMITKASGAMVKNILLSDYVTGYNPIITWFQQSRWDGKDHIKELAGTIVAEDTERWQLYLRRWLIATVANANTLSGCQNHTCLVLVGAQGKGKTTWFNQLVPEDLTDYYFVGKINVEDKDALSLIAEKFLVNIDDQLTSINRKDEDAIKAIITLPEVSYRRPYDIYIQRYPRIASICASVNKPGFLTDDTGNRRFLPIGIKDVHLDQLPAVDKAGVWAQAYALWKQGEQYWFSKEEIDALNHYNENFRMDTWEYEALSTIAVAPNHDNRDYCKWLTNNELCSLLKDRYRREPNFKQVGVAMRRLNMLPQQKKRNGVAQQCYWVEILDQHMIEAQQKDSKPDEPVNF